MLIWSIYKYKNQQNYSSIFFLKKPIVITTNTMTILLLKLMDSSYSEDVLHFQFQYLQHFLS